MRLLPIVISLLVLCALPARAQQPAPAAPPAGAAPVRPDIEFNASVHMDSIEFAGAPQASVRFTGGPRVEVRHDVERGTLPRPVASGRTYRNVTVHTTISATLLDPALEAGPSAQASPPPSPPTNDEDSP